MRRLAHCLLLLLSFCGFLFSFAVDAVADESWALLQKQYGEESQHSRVVKITRAVRLETQVDNKPRPNGSWQQLQSGFLCFSPRSPETISSSSGSGSGDALSPYATIIHQAAVYFDIPVEIIAAVIMVESSGNPNARASTSSAKGLMQTIDATFAEARDGLRKEGKSIVNNPLDPHASIWAGSWYLNQMYEQATIDRGRLGMRSTRSSWVYPLQYYYAGPTFGRQNENVVYIRVGQRSVVVDKSAYSQKVLSKARGVFRA